MDQVHEDTAPRQEDRVVLRIERSGGRELRVVEGRWRGRTWIHVREWFQIDDGELRPGRGVALTPAEAAQVVSALDELLLGGAGR